MKKILILFLLLTTTSLFALSPSSVFRPQGDMNGIKRIRKRKCVRFSYPLSILDDETLVYVAKTARKSGIDFKTLLNQKEIKLALISRGLLSKSVNCFVVEELGTGSEKSVYKVRIYYVDNTFYTIKIAKYLEGTNYLDASLAGNSFFRTYYTLLDLGLFNDGIIVPYFYKMATHPIFIGEYQEGAMSQSSHDAKLVSAYLYLRTIFRYMGLTYADINGFNFLVVSTPKSNKIKDRLKIVDYPLGSGEGLTIKWEGVRLASFLKQNDTPSFRNAFYEVLPEVKEFHKFSDFLKIIYNVTSFWKGSSNELFHIYAKCDNIDMRILCNMVRVA